MTVSKLAPFAAALVLVAIATHANAAPRHQQQGQVIQGDYGNAFNSDYRDPTSREALDEGTW